MYDEAGVSFGGPSGGGITSADLGGGPSFGGDSRGYDDSVRYQPTTAQLSNIGPTQVGDSFVDKIKDYLGQRPTASRGIGALLGNIIGNAFLPGIGGLLGSYLGQRRAGDYLNQYGLTRDTERDYLGGTLGKSIYTPPRGINNIRTNPNIINPNTIPDLNDPFYSNMLYAQAPANDIKNQFAYVTEQDIARRNMQLGEMQKTNYETAKDIGLINPTMTEYEYNQLIQGNITQPGTYVG
jgi:hypothetical protein